MTLFDATREIGEGGEGRVRQLPSSPLHLGGMKGRRNSVSGGFGCSGTTGTRRHLGRFLAVLAIRRTEAQSDRVGAKSVCLTGTYGGTAMVSDMFGVRTVFEGPPSPLSIPSIRGWQGEHLHGPALRRQHGRDARGAGERSRSQVPFS